MADVTEQQISEINNLQRQLQMIMMQRQQLSLGVEEMTMAELELSKSKGAVYRAAGALLIESNKEDAQKEIKEKLETTNLRLAVLGKQEEKLKTRFNELREKIEGAMKQKKGN